MVAQSRFVRGGHKLRSPEVVIVSTNPDTRDGLQSYLRGAGVTVHPLHNLDEFSRRADNNIDALVLFPDDFRWESVLAAIAELAERHPAALPVLVTARPQRFENLADTNMLVVPRPVWGWKILDAIRAHVENLDEKRKANPSSK